MRISLGVLLLAVALGVVGFFTYAAFVSTDSEEFLGSAGAWARAAGAGVITITVTLAIWLMTQRIRAARAGSNDRGASSRASASDMSSAAAGEGSTAKTMSDLRAGRDIHVTVEASREDRGPVDRPPAKQPEKRERGRPDVYIARLPRTGAEFVGRDDQLKALDDAWADGKTSVVEVVAWGGVGKSALVNRWVGVMTGDDYRGAKKVYAWSFYSQGTSETAASSDQFVSHALEWFGDPDPTRGSPWDKGERLANLVREQRTLLILDGLEPLQAARPEEGRIRDPALQTLLKELAGSNPGLCVVTTRIRATDLDGMLGTSVALIALEHLSREAGIELLRSLDVTGTDPELEAAVEEFKGHALALTLLGSLLRDGYGGDIRRWREVPPLETSDEKGGHARRVMESYERWFGGRRAAAFRLLSRVIPWLPGWRANSPEVAVLGMLGLFNRPADGAAIEALRRPPAIRGLTDPIVGIDEARWASAVARLRRARLVAQVDATQPDALDAHPLVREHFAERLKGDSPRAWREASGRLYDHYRDTAKPLPDTSEEMQPLYHAVAHGCEAGRHQEALDEVYRARIQRGNELFCTRKLGAFGANLAVLSGFFDPPWHRPVAALRDAARAFVLNEVGINLRAVGRLGEAVEAMRAALEAYEAQKDWQNAAWSAGNLGELYSTMGELAEALRFTKQAVERADRSEEEFGRLRRRAQLGDTLHLLGRVQEAEAAFAEAEAIQRARQSEAPLLYQVEGFWYCDLLLTRGKHEAVLERATQTLVWAADAKLSLPAFALDHLSLGRAHMMKAQAEGGRDFSRAAGCLDESVRRLHDAGRQDQLPRGLLARAELRRMTKDHAGAHRDLDEVMTIAERGGMRRYEADCHLGYARLAMAEEDRTTAREHLDTAKRMIQEMGYRRRDLEVAELEKELAQPVSGA